MLGRAYHWYLHARRLGFLIFAASMLWAGHGLSDAVAGLGSSSGVDALTRTIHYTHSETRFVTVHIRGRVVRHTDHVLVVYVPRTVFHTKGANRRRVVIPAHRVKIRERQPGFGVTSAVIGVSPLPVTVTVPVDVPVPGPTVTVTGPTTTLPQATTTVTVPVTITLPLTGGD